MDRLSTSAYLHSATLPDLQRGSPPYPPSVCEAARGQTRDPSPASTLFLSVVVWAVVWAAFASLSSWLK